MRALIAEDEFIGRLVLEKLLSPFFDVDMVVNGREAVEAFALAQSQETPYHLILLDIMMPEVDGLTALEKIRMLEEERGAPPVKVIMTTALDEPKTVIRSFHEGGASGYVVKPIERKKLYTELEKLGLITS